jgi:hypothetical protein
MAATDGSSRVGGVLRTGSAPEKENIKEEIKSFFPLRQGVVCRISNYVYRQIYRQLIQPTDREAVCNLFNALHIT